jgi:hypothetical protein
VATNPRTAPVPIDQSARWRASDPQILTAAERALVGVALDMRASAMAVTAGSVTP